MDRTQGTNYDTVGGKRQFTDGPPGTTVEEDFLNAVQEELVATIEAAGLTSSTGDNTQLLQALNAKITALHTFHDVPYVAGNFTGGAGTWTVQAGDINHFRYCVAGKMMWVSVSIKTAVIGGVTPVLHLVIPGNYTASQIQSPGFARVVDGSGVYAASPIYVSGTTPTRFSIYKDASFATNYVAGANEANFITCFRID
jgi:hypothetical protein